MDWWRCGAVGGHPVIASSGLIVESLKKYALLVALGAGAVFAVVYYAKKGAVAAGQIASTKLNPYSNQNAVYQNVIGGAGRAVTGNQSWTLGGAIYDLFNPSTAAAQSAVNQAKLGYAPRAGAGAVK